MNRLIRRARTCLALRPLCPKTRTPRSCSPRRRLKPRVRMGLAALTMALGAPAVHAADGPHLAAARSSGDTAPTAAAPERLVVHEWGTFTSVAGEDGVALEWQPLVGPSDLPDFVYDVNDVNAGTRDAGLRAPPTEGRRLGAKSALRGSVRMETPVVYFYADENIDVSLGVRFPGGGITEWYPAVEELGATHNGRVPGRVHWGTFRVMPHARAPLPHDGSTSHYYPARATDAAQVRVRTTRGFEYEKFLFYRGVGSFAQPLSAALAGDHVALGHGGRASAVPEGPRPPLQAIVFEKHGERMAFTEVQVPEAGTRVSRPLAAGREGTQAALERALHRMLAQSGLYDKEAAAMIATWRDHWFEDGLRVFYVLPTRATEALLPMAIKPAPTELVRTLVGRVDLITAADEARVRRALGPAMKATPDWRALDALRETHGRFLPVIVRRVAPLVGLEGEAFNRVWAHLHAAQRAAEDAR